MVVSCYSPISYIYEFTLLHIIVRTWYYQTLNFGQSSAYSVASHYSFKSYFYLHFLDQTTFYVFSNNSCFLYMKFFISVICPFFYWNVCFFLINLYSLYILGTNPMEVMWLPITSPGLWLDFSFP